MRACSLREVSVIGETVSCSATETLGEIFHRISVDTEENYFYFSLNIWMRVTCIYIKYIKSIKQT